jgi:putative intracellular protease/amidase
VKNRLTLALRLVVAGLIAWGVVLAQVAQKSSASTEARLAPPAKGPILVAFVVTDGAVMIDFAGPWEVFEEVHIESRGSSMEEQMPFRFYTVSDSKSPIRISGGMQIVPDYSFDDAPRPNVVVIPAQGGKSPKMLAWIRKMTQESDVVMSVCTGAFKLAATGALDGKKATTHHAAYTRFQKEFPDVTLVKNARYVQSDPRVFTAGGLSSGIDLALHIVELYFGRGVAENTARALEYEGHGWMGGGASAVNYSQPVASAHPSDGLTGGALGNWQGTIETDSGSGQVLVHIWKDKGGSLTGTVDSVDEDANGIPITSISGSSSEVHFELATVGGVYDGKIDGADSTITGTWKQRDSSTPLVLHRLTK